MFAAGAGFRPGRCRTTVRDLLYSLGFLSISTKVEIFSTRHICFSVFLVREMERTISPGNFPEVRRTRNQLVAFLVDFPRNTKQQEAIRIVFLEEETRGTFFFFRENAHGEDSSS